MIIDAKKLFEPGGKMEPCECKTCKAIESEVLKQMSRMHCPEILRTEVPMLLTQAYLYEAHARFLKSRGSELRKRAAAILKKFAKRRVR